MNRASIIRGPAVVEFNSQVFYSSDDITVAPQITTFEVPSSIHGKVDDRLDNIMVEITFTPAGQWVAGHLPVLWPHGTPVIGSSIFGAVDKDVVIQTLAGQRITFKAGAITKMPELILSTVKPAMGQVTISCIGQQDTAWTDAAKRAVIAAQAFADTSFDPASIKTVPYSGAWGVASPWDDIQTEAGWTISFDLKLEDVPIDSEGIVDKTLADVGVMAKCVPVGISESDLLSLIKIQGTGVSRGATLANNANDLVISGGSGNPEITISNAAPKEAGFRFGQTVLRAGEVGFAAQASFTTGVRNAVFAIGTGA